MSWKIRTDALVNAFSCFHNLGKLDCTSAVVSERAPIGQSERAFYPRYVIIKIVLWNFKCCNMRPIRPLIHRSRS